MNIQLRTQQLLAASALALTACGGGGGAAPAAATAAAAAAGTLTVSVASNAARNGSYTPAGARFTSAASTDFGFNGSTADGKFEVEVVVSAGGVIQRAHIWFFDGGTPRFFGCDGGRSIACTGVGWEPLLRQVLFNSTVQFAEVNANLAGTAPDVLIGGGETFKVLGSLDVR